MDGIGDMGDVSFGDVSGMTGDMGGFGDIGNAGFGMADSGLAGMFGGDMGGAITSDEISSILGMFGLDSPGVSGNENDNGDFSMGLEGFQGMVSPDDSGSLFSKQLLNFLSKGLPPPMQAALAIGKNGLTGQTVGNITQGMLTGMMGPIGLGLNALGSITGQSLGNSIAAIPGMNQADTMTANADVSNPANSAGGLMGGGWGDIAQGLAGMYMGNKAQKGYSGAIGSLNDLYSPQGALAQQMRQAIERKDAAGGRRSQYGPREAQLAAALAGMHGQALTSPGYGNLLKQQQVSGNQGLNTLMALMKSGGLNRIGKMVGPALGGLSGLFSGGSQGGGMDMLGGLSDSFSGMSSGGLPNFFDSGLGSDISSLWGD